MLAVTGITQDQIIELTRFESKLVRIEPVFFDAIFANVDTDFDRILL